MTAPTEALPGVRALAFDVFGTVVDWRGSIIRDLGAFGAERGLTADWAALVDAWRGRYQPSMEAVRSGERPWVPLDALHRESLDALLPAFGLAGLGERERAHLNLVWHRLDPWPDAVAGLRRLRTRFRLATLSNGNVGLLADMATRAGLPWDAILGAEPTRSYKPMAECYLGSARLLGLAPGECCLVAAHNGDLAAAAALGFRTAFVHRPTEHGPGQHSDLAPEGPWDVVADDFEDLAEQLRSG